MLHTGPTVLEVGDADGGLVLSWPQMALLSVVRPVDGVADSLSAAELQTCRGSKGYFHMAVEVPGLPPLWLTPKAGSVGAAGLAKIVVKDERLSMLGPSGWKKI